MKTIKDTNKRTSGALKPQMLANKKQTKEREPTLKPRKTKAQDNPLVNGKVHPIHQARHP